MITQYTFDADTAELVGETTYEGSLVTLVWHSSYYDWTHYFVTINVREGDDALSEMMNWFGDDSSWPEGWWSKMLDGLVSKLRMP